MDSLTQIVLGASVAALAAPPARRRTALVLGAVLGTLPDLDVIVLKALEVDAVANVTWHRGPSHALPVLAVLGLLIAMGLRRWWPAWREAPWRWFAAVELALLTHPLLDAFTVYGTQLWWPWASPPVMWSSIFIIDPLYTLPLLLACIAAWIIRDRQAARTWLVTGLVLSCGYLGWSLLAKELVERAAGVALAGQGLADAPRFSVPMPFNTLLWRVVAMTPQGYVEGERSVVADRGPMRFRAYSSDAIALAAVRDAPGVRRLDWFTHGFLKVEARGNQLVLSDLRMGSEPDYTFRFVVAESDDAGNWRAVPAIAIAWPWEARRYLGTMWQRIWTEPPAD